MSLWFCLKVSLLKSAGWLFFLSFMVSLSKIRHVSREKRPLLGLKNLAIFRSSNLCKIDNFDNLPVKSVITIFWTPKRYIFLWHVSILRAWISSAPPCTILCVFFYVFYGNDCGFCAFTCKKTAFRRELSWSILSDVIWLILYLYTQYFDTQSFTFHTFIWICKDAARPKLGGHEFS